MSHTNGGTEAIIELFNQAANRDLRALSVDGRKNFHRTRYRLAARIELQPDSCGGLLQAGPRDGFFAKMDFSQILSACFDKDAIELLLESAGNQYQFWNIVSDLFHASPSGYLSNFDLPLPCSRSELQARLDRLRPFGFSSTASDWRLEQFNLRLAAGFDVDKLEPAYAAELLDAGIVLLYVPFDFKQNARLVISPLFRKLVPGYQKPADVECDFWGQ